MAGEVKYRLTLDTSKFNANAKSAASGLKDLGGAASVVGQKFGMLGTAMTSLGPAGLAAAGAIGAVSAAFKGIKAQDEQIDAINRLNLALANQGNYSKSASSDLQAYASQLQNVTTVGDEAILKNQALLASYGLQGESLKRVTQAALDFSAATGTDLRAAFDLLGKASTGYTGTLSRYGILVDSSKSSTERFEEALAQVETRFSGSATMSAQTFSGGLQQVKNAAGDAWEALGKLLSLGAEGDPFGPIKTGLQWLTRFLGQDLVLAASEMQAIFWESLAGVVDALAFAQKSVKATGAVIKGELEDMWDFWGTGSLKAREDPVIEASKGLTEFSEKARKVAAGVREEGNQIATTAGKTREFTNVTRKTGDAADTTAAKLKKLTDEVKRGSGGDWTGYGGLLEGLTGDLRSSTLGRRSTDTDQMGTDAMAIAVQRQKEILEKSEAVGESASKTKDQTIEWSVALQDVANQFQTLASIGGPVGSLLDMMGQIAGSATGIGASLENWGKASQQGGFSGFLGKVASGAGLLGGVVGIGSSIIKGIGGLFGGGDKKKEEEERKKKVAEMTTEIESLGKKFEELQREILTNGVKALGDAFDYLANQTDLTQERFDRMSTIGIAMFTSLREQGYSTVDAMRMMGDSLNAALKAAKEQGLEIPAAFKQLTAFQNKINNNEGLVSYAESLDDIIAALRATGSIGPESFAAINAAAGEVSQTYEDLIAQGFTQGQALQLIGPALYQLKEAAAQYGITLDEATMKLIGMAEEKGAFEGMVDPMEKLIEVQQMGLQLMASMVELLGGQLPEAVQKYVQSLNSIPTSVTTQVTTTGGSVPTGGVPVPVPYGQPGGAPGSIKHFGRGGFVNRTQLAIVGEVPEYIIPASNLENPGGGGGGRESDYERRGGQESAYEGGGGGSGGFVAGMASTMAELVAAVKEQSKRPTVEALSVAPQISVVQQPGEDPRALTMRISAELRNATAPELRSAISDISEGRL